MYACTHIYVRVLASSLSFIQQGAMNCYCRPQIGTGTVL